MYFLKSVCYLKSDIGDQGGICKNIDIEKNQLNIRSYVDYGYEVSTSTNWSFLRRFMAKMSEHFRKDLSCFA